MATKEKKDDSLEVLEAFGHNHTTEEWAKMLKLPDDDFRYYTADKGLTIEELYALRGFTYKEPKKGARMVEAWERLRPIFDRSGYDPDKLTVEYKLGAPVHVIKFDGSTVGRYFYKEARLVLAGGEGIFLDRLEPEKVKVQNRGGVWVWHPVTRDALIDSIMSRH